MGKSGQEKTHLGIKKGGSQGLGDRLWPKGRSRPTGVVAEIGREGDRTCGINNNSIGEGKKRAKKNEGSVWKGRKIRQGRGEKSRGIRGQQKIGKVIRKICRTNKKESSKDPKELREWGLRPQRNHWFRRARLLQGETRGGPGVQKLIDC